jgi:predicted signal transduction protein with EAL and GGDEF domain
VNTLEAKLREALVDHATNSTKAFDELKVMNEQMKDVIKANTDALQGVLRWIEREK